MLLFSCYWRHLSDKSTVDGGPASVTDDVLSDIASEPDPWDTDEPNRARILWVKNLTRLRHQVRFFYICLHVIYFVTIDTSD